MRAVERTDVLGPADAVERDLASDLGSDGGHVALLGTPDGIRGDYLFFVHSFRDGRVARIAAHMSKEAALADIAARYGGRAWPS